MREASSRRATLRSFGTVVAVCAALGIVTSLPSQAAVARGNREAVIEQRAATTVLDRINAMREQHGLSPGVATNAFKVVTMNAARGLTDPLTTMTRSMIEEFGVWGLTGTGGPAAIVNTWVYHDGWNGSSTSNLDCTSPTASGCNGHMRAILSEPPSLNAHLYIDIAAVRMPTGSGSPGDLSVAALLVWKGSSPSPARLSRRLPHGTFGASS